MALRLESRVKIGNQQQCPCWFARAAQTRDSDIRSGLSPLQCPLGCFLLHLPPGPEDGQLLPCPQQPLRVCLCTALCCLGVQASWIRATVMTSLWLSSFCEGPVSKYGHVMSSQRSELHSVCGFWECGSTVQPPTVPGDPASSKGLQILPVPEKAGEARRAVPWVCALPGAHSLHGARSVAASPRAKHATDAAPPTLFLEGIPNRQHI